MGFKNISCCKHTIPFFMYYPCKRGNQLTTPKPIPAVTIFLTRNLASLNTASFHLIRKEAGNSFLCPICFFLYRLVVDFKCVVVIFTNKWHCFTQFSTYFFDFKIGCLFTVSSEFWTASLVVIYKVICKFTILNVC